MSLACILGSNPSVMKKLTFLLALTGLSLAAATGYAALPDETDTFLLPAYTVSADRYTAAEKSIRQNLAELRAAARPAGHIDPELPSFATAAPRQDTRPATGKAIANQGTHRSPGRS